MTIDSVIEIRELAFEVIIGVFENIVDVDEEPALVTLGVPFLLPPLHLFPVTLSLLIQF
jgi:hypothetical protein